MSENNKERSFLQELSRRRVVGSAIAYVLAAWVLIQVADVLGDGFGAPGWFVRALTTVLLLIFPAFIVFSWEYNVTRKGLERTDGDLDRGFSGRPVVRRSIVGIVALLSITAIWWTWQAGVLTDESFIKRDDDFPKIIAVDGFQTFAAEGSGWLGDGVSNLVRDNLARSRFLRVISLRRWRALSEGGDAKDAVNVAASADIDYLVQGEVIGSRSGFVLTIRLTDTQDGEQLDSQTYEVDEESLLLERATSIAQNVRAQLKVPVQEQVDIYAADFAADNPSAYRAFTGALDYWLNYEFAQAERLFGAAIELQPDFTMANYHLAQVLTSQDKFDEAVAAIERAAANAEGREAEYIDAYTYLLNRDAVAAISAYEKLVEKYPNDTELRWLFATAHEINYDNVAAADVYRMLTTLEPEVHEGWSALAYYEIQNGEFDTAKSALDEFIRLAPANPNGFVLRGDLNRAIRNLPAARDDYQQAISIGSELQEADVSLGQVYYLMGETDKALAALDALIRDTDAIPRYRIAATFEAGGILNSLERHEDYVEYLDLLEQEFIASEIFYAKALSEKATALLWSSGPNDDVVALIDQSIAKSPGVPTRYLFARGLLELAREDYAAIENTAAEIRSFALPPEDPDRTEDMAADYLLGRAALRRGDVEIAVELLQRATSLDGHQYRLYALAYAEALLAAGKTQEALNLLETATPVSDPVDPRLDLERDRRLARDLSQSYVKPASDRS